MFTNVAFLQKISSENRKSSRIKKWLTLFTRMLLLATLVFAFAQPYFSNGNIDEKQHHFIYLDNSLSTNTKGSKGNLLEVAKKELLESLDKDTEYSLLTNTNFHKNIGSESLKDILFQTKSSASKTPLDEVLLQIENHNKTKVNTANKNLLISDFQNVKPEEFTTTNNSFNIVQQLPEKLDNISIDSVFVSKSNTNNFTVKAIIKNSGEAKNNVPIAIANDKKLISKQTFDIETDNSKTVEFVIQKEATFLGKLSINFNDTYSFDNEFYFSVNTNPKTNVQAIGTNNDFLAKIYTNDEFNFINNSPKNINFNSIEQQQLIILNELETFSPSLIGSNTSFTKKGGQVIVIPNEKSDVNSYNLLFKNLGNGKITTVKKDTLKVTNINFNHPIFKGVFQKKVSNFQYPEVKSYFPNTFSNASNLISLENNEGFIQQINLNNGNLFWIAAPLDKTNSNFTNSPLIVPVFYNIGQQSLQLSKLYYTINEENKIDVKANLVSDKVLSIQNDESSFIPLQQNQQNKVTLTTKEQPIKNGFYHILQEQDTIQAVSFNYNKKESSLQFLDVQSIVKNNDNLSFSSSVKDTLQEIDKKNKVHWLWKWFLILAIVSLLLEILILKYFKV